jgi:hypothetical protein
MGHRKSMVENITYVMAGEINNNEDSTPTFSSFESALLYSNKQEWYRTAIITPLTNMAENLAIKGLISARWSIIEFDGTDSRK